MSETPPRRVSRVRIALIYAGLAVVMMIFFLALTLISDNARYPTPWINGATVTILDVVKLLIGAVIGALTPGLLDRIGAGRKR